ncbi:hypothetical protein SUGI_0566650 [Cryptomeria japonica]|nr:hypothetical protein SUGI_0566650 [Cryptomeria japonica]
MKVTVAFNHFGSGLIERMPRCRHGYVHVANREYMQLEEAQVMSSEAKDIGLWLQTRSIRSR